MWKIYKLHTSADETPKYIGITKGTIKIVNKQFKIKYYEPKK